MPSVTEFGGNGSRSAATGLARGNGSRSAATGLARRQRVSLGGNGSRSAATGLARRQRARRQRVSLGGNGSRSAATGLARRQRVSLGGNGSRSAATGLARRQRVSLGGNGSRSAAKFCRSYLFIIKQRLRHLPTSFLLFGFLSLSCTNYQKLRFIYFNHCCEVEQKNMILMYSHFYTKIHKKLRICVQHGSSDILLSLNIVYEIIPLCASSVFSRTTIDCFAMVSFLFQSIVFQLLFLLFLYTNFLVYKRYSYSHDINFIHNGDNRGHVDIKNSD